MTYNTMKNRLQITTKAGLYPAEKFHEDRGDGTPICGTVARTLRGQPLVFTSVGPGEVTCERCGTVAS